MKDADFNVDLSWSGTGREGAGEVVGDDVVFEISSPRAMGGRGSGTNPEELLVSAVSSCYAATLFAVLERDGLPAKSLQVRAKGTVVASSGGTRFRRLAVSPTVLGGDPSRQAEYEVAAAVAHDRCLIGKALSSEVIYEVEAANTRPGGDEAPAPRRSQRDPSSAGVVEAISR